MKFKFEKINLFYKSEDNKMSGDYKLGHYYTNLFESEVWKILRIYDPLEYPFFKTVDGLLVLDEEKNNGYNWIVKKVFDANNPFEKVITSCICNPVIRDGIRHYGVIFGHNVELTREIKLLT